MDWGQPLCQLWSRPQASWGDSGYLASLLLRPREALLRCWQVRLLWGHQDSCATRRDMVQPGQQTPCCWLQLKIAQQLRPCSGWPVCERTSTSCPVYTAHMQDTDSLFSSITDWQAQPIGLRHPFGFYYGHCAAFARLKMLPQVWCVAGLGLQMQMVVLQFEVLLRVSELACRHELESPGCLPLARDLQEKDAALDVMLSRGIDPLVLDPSRCSALAHAAAGLGKRL